MVAKLVTWGEDRDDAIARMSTALDQFVVRGIQSNIAFLSALVTHDKYISGDINTNTIAEEYPEGFNPSDVPQADPSVAIAVVGTMVRKYRDRAAEIDGQLPGHRREVPTDWVVVDGDDQYPISVVRKECCGSEVCYVVTYDGKDYEVCTDWDFGEHLFSGTVNGQDVHMQVARNGQVYSLVRRGAQADVLVLSPRSAELHKLMPVKVPPDTSGQIIAPMPGLIVSVAVAEGDEVKAGDELAVLEAMKMENALRAERNGVVAKVNHKAGESVEVDQIIMELE